MSGFTGPDGEVYSDLSQRERALLDGAAMWQKRAEEGFTVEEIRERMLRDEVIDADAGARWIGVNDHSRAQSRHALGKALDAAFPANSSSTAGGESA